MAEEISNFVPLNRKLFDHWLWKEKREYSRVEAWIDLIREARYDDELQTRIINGKRVVWGRAQIPVSLRFLGERWGWSTKKVNSFLNLLELDKMIKKETQEETGQTVITLLNFDSYNGVIKNWKQQGEQQGNSEETPRKQQGNKTNKENTVNTEKKKARLAPAAPALFDEEKKLREEYSQIEKIPDVRERFAALRDFIKSKRPPFPEPYVYLWNLFAKKHQLAGVGALTDEKLKKFRVRVREERFDFVDILHKVAQTSWLLGENTRGWKVNWNYLFRNEENYNNILDDVN